jgi:hypothetical protein
MNDTSRTVAIHFRGMMMRRTPEERVVMGCSMFDAAKQIAKSAITEQYPQILPHKLKEAIFLRFYGKEFDEACKERILKAL